MLPAIFNENLFDNFFNDDFYMPSVFGGKNDPLYGKHAKNVMKTDVRETDNSYELDIDLPGFKKEDVSLKLDSGYLTISASKGLEKDEKEKKDGKYIDTRYPNADLSILEGTVKYPVFAVAVQADGFDTAAAAMDAAFGANYNPWGGDATNWQ